MKEEIFQRTCLNHFFELKIADLHKKGLIKIPIYLSLGSEHVAAAVSCAFPNCSVFPQHRCHSWFLSYGGTPEKILTELLNGKEGSASLSKDNFFGHSGLLGDQIPIGVGYACFSNKKTLIIAGDAAIEEDYALASLGYAATKKAPVLFLIEDNDLSILTKKSVRRSWDIVSVANGFGIPSFNISDSPIELYETVKNITLPCLINARICRHLWHAGSGCDGTPEWNTFEKFRFSDKIENEAKERIEKICQKMLLKL